ncbi:MAG: class I SAM-dependent methyltransferase [Alphaproteobacteria bacterium]
MSRLDSAIARLTAQKLCLDSAAVAIRGLPGPVLELGLGNGRTYDHLRVVLPDRAIYAFDRQCAAAELSTPPKARLMLGEIPALLRAQRPRFAGRVALAHLDLGAGSAAMTAGNLAGVVPALLPLLRAGARVLSDQPLAAADLTECVLPPGVAAGRYFSYRRI